jgi:hypothetical protein
MVARGLMQVAALRPLDIADARVENTRPGQIREAGTDASGRNSPLSNKPVTRIPATWRFVERGSTQCRFDRRGPTALAL